MLLIISMMVILASLLAIVSGVWVIMGLMTELIHPSESSQEPTSAVSSDNPHKSENSTELL